MFCQSVAFVLFFVNVWVAEENTAMILRRLPLGGYYYGKDIKKPLKSETYVS